MGRPEIYTPELAAEICRRLTLPESLRSICRDEAMPSRPVVQDWIVQDKHGFAAQYVRAKAVGIDQFAEETLEIADDGSNDWMERQNEKGGVVEVVDQDHIARSRLRVDTRKWYVSKLAPKLYGERMAHEVSGPDGGAIELDDSARLRRLEALIAAVEARQKSDGSDLV